MKSAATGAVETAAESVYNMPGSDPSDHEEEKTLSAIRPANSRGRAHMEQRPRYGLGNNSRSSKMFGKNR